MPIQVNYSPTPTLLGSVAQGIGADRGQSLALQDALRVQGLVNQNTQFNQSLAQRYWSQQYDRQTRIGQQKLGIYANRATQERSIYARQQMQAREIQAQQEMAQYAAQQRREMAMFERQGQIEDQVAEQAFRNELFQQQAQQRRAEQQQAQEHEMEMRFSEPQRREQRQIQEGRALALQRKEQGLLNEQEFADVWGQLDARQSGIRAWPHFPEEKPPSIDELTTVIGSNLMALDKDGVPKRLGVADAIYPEGQRIGQSWGVGNGAAYHREPDGKVFEMMKGWEGVSDAQRKAFVEQAERALSGMVKTVTTGEGENAISETVPAYTPQQFTELVEYYEDLADYRQLMNRYQQQQGMQLTQTMPKPVPPTPPAFLQSSQRQEQGGMTLRGMRAWDAAKRLDVPPQGRPKWYEDWQGHHEWVHPDAVPPPAEHTNLNPPPSEEFEGIRAQEEAAEAIRALKDTIAETDERL